MDDRSLQIGNLEIRIRMLREEQRRLFAVSADAAASPADRRKAVNDAAELAQEILRTVRELRTLEQETGDNCPPRTLQQPRTWQRIERRVTQLSRFPVSLDRVLRSRRSPPCHRLHSPRSGSPADRRGCPRGRDRCPPDGRTCIAGLDRFSSASRNPCQGGQGA